MKIGISTASLFGRKNTEDALEFLSKNKVETSEVFLESFSEYNRAYGKILASRKGGIDVHSMHVLTTQFEPQLYSLNQRAKSDSFEFLDTALQAGQEVGAKYYTFHGPARLKRTPIVINFDRIGSITQDIMAYCQKYGITLAFENVHWSYYNYIGFFKELRARATGLKGTLDIKQARQSGIAYSEFLDEMAGDIVTVHLSDVDAKGKMCLPGKGITDFSDLFSRLLDVGFDGSCLIEAYANDFSDETELFQAVDYLKNVSAKIYK